jgi:hypothetical protein
MKAVDQRFMLERTTGRMLDAATDAAEVLEAGDAQVEACMDELLLEVIREANNARIKLLRYRVAKTWEEAGVL